MSETEPAIPEERERPRRRPLVEIGLGAAWLLGLAAALTLADGLLSSVPLARAILGGLLASLAAGRAGVVWDRADPDGLSPRRAVHGAALGVGAAATAGLAALVISHVVGAGTITPGRPSLMLGFALLAAIGTAVREEILFRALPMHFAARAGLDRRFAIAFATLASPTPFLLASTTSPASIALAMAGGLLSARLLDRTGSLWASVGANAAFSMLVGALTAGGLFDIDWHRGELARGPSASGLPAIVAAVALALVAIAAGRGPLRLAGEPQPTAPRSPRSRRR